MHLLKIALYLCLLLVCQNSYGVLDLCSKQRKDLYEMSLTPEFINAKGQSSLSTVSQGNRETFVRFSNNTAVINLRGYPKIKLIAKMSGQKIRFQLENTSDQPNSKYYLEVSGVNTRQSANKLEDGQIIAARLEIVKVSGFKVFLFGESRQTYFIEAVAKLSGEQLIERRIDYATSQLRPYLNSDLNSVLRGLKYNKKDLQRHLAHFGYNPLTSSDSKAVKKKLEEWLEVDTTNAPQGLTEVKKLPEDVQVALAELLSDIKKDNDREVCLICLQPIEKLEDPVLIAKGKDQAGRFRYGIMERKYLYSLDRAEKGQGRIFPGGSVFTKFYPVKQYIPQP